jgi:DNA-binding transcriptional MerR regulator
MYFSYLGFSIGFGFLMLLAFGILHWLQIPSGNLVDWLIGIASFWWLLVIVTVPWNIYFDAQEVIAEAAISKEKRITFDEKQLNYVKQVSRWGILLAIALHAISAIVLYILAAAGISAVGYVSSGATLLLTILRPAIRAYQYIAVRLSTIRQQIKYPREDVLELRDRVRNLETTIKQIEEKLDLNNPHSLVAQQQREWQETRQELNRLRALLEQFQAKNQVEHEQLSQEARSAIAQLTEDSQFLNHAREIIRFFKTA